MTTKSAKWRKGGNSRKLICFMFVWVCLVECTWAPYLCVHLLYHSAHYYFLPEHVYRFTLLTHTWKCWLFIRGGGMIYKLIYRKINPLPWTYIQNFHKPTINLLVLSNYILCKTTVKIYGTPLQQIHNFISPSCNEYVQIYAPFQESLTSTLSK